VAIPNKFTARAFCDANSETSLGNKKYRVCAIVIDAKTPNASAMPMTYFIVLPPTALQPLLKMPYAAVFGTKPAKLG
jgi:hypothetical protein